jgi:NADH-quinone oxidoreductase subunit M
MALGVAGIIYGAVLAFAQTDLKRLVAYTSVSHMGFVFLGIYSFSGIALQGVVMQMLSHGISTGALFMLVGALQERTHTRDMDRMGGLWTITPRMGGVVLFFALASLGLPGMGNFIAEILVLIGSYRVNVPITVIASVGLVFATVYALWILYRAFHGEPRVPWKIKDLSMREMAAITAMIIVILWLGLYPQPFLDTAQPSLSAVKQSVEKGYHSAQSAVLQDSGMLKTTTESANYYPDSRERRRNLYFRLSRRRRLFLGIQGASDCGRFSSRPNPSRNDEGTVAFFRGEEDRYE